MHFCFQDTREPRHLDPLLNQEKDYTIYKEISIRIE